MFGLGFGMVTQVLIVAVQNASIGASSASRRPRPASSARSAARSGAAVLGAVFAAQAGSHATEGPTPALRADVIDGVQAVFLVAAPLAALALVVVLRLPERPLQTTNRKS